MHVCPQRMLDKEDCKLDRVFPDSLSLIERKMCEQPACIRKYTEQYLHCISVTEYHKITCFELEKVIKAWGWISLGS